MNKRIKGLITLTLTLAISTSVLAFNTPRQASALTQLDVIYKDAYDATINALNKKTQDSIIDARVAIGKLPSSLKPAIGEFSKLVDTVQHPILVKIIQAILTAQQAGSQSNINSARNTIPYNLPSNWKNSYSTAIDTIQQKLIIKADDAYKKACQTLTEKDVTYAKSLINELKTVENNQTVLNWTLAEESLVNNLQPIDVITQKGSVSFNPGTSGSVGEPVTLSYSSPETSLEYRFLTNDGSGWTVARDYSTDSTFKWFPLKTGNFNIRIDVRHQGNVAEKEFFAEGAFTATPLANPNPAPPIVEVNYNWNGPLSYGNNPQYIILHHAEASNASALDIHSWHLQNGWVGIGYHFYVRKDGTIYRGRPENAIGAQCLGYNTISLGICVEGSYVKETMPEAQKQAVISLGRYLKNKYNISLVKGHGELNATDCPGPFYPLNDIRNAILKP